MPEANESYTSDNKKMKAKSAYELVQAYRPNLVSAINYCRKESVLECHIFLYCAVTLGVTPADPSVGLLLMHARCHSLV